MDDRAWVDGGVRLVLVVYLDTTNLTSFTFHVASYVNIMPVLMPINSPRPNLSSSGRNCFFFLSCSSPCLYVYVCVCLCWCVGALAVRFSRCSMLVEEGT